MRRLPLLIFELANWGLSEIRSTGNCRALRRKFSSSGGFENHKLDTPRKPLSRLSQEEEIQNDS